MKTRRILSALVALVLILGVFPTMVLASEGQPYHPVYSYLEKYGEAEQQAVANARAEVRDWVLANLGRPLGDSRNTPTQYAADIFGAVPKLTVEEGFYSEAETYSRVWRFLPYQDGMKMESGDILIEKSGTTGQYSVIVATNSVDYVVIASESGVVPNARLQEGWRHGRNCVKVGVLRPDWTQTIMLVGEPDEILDENKPTVTAPTSTDWWVQPIFEALQKNFIPEVIHGSSFYGAGELSKLGEYAFYSASKNGFDTNDRIDNPITRNRFARLAIYWIEYVEGKPIADVISAKGLTPQYGVFVDTDDPYIIAAYTLGIISGTKAPTDTSRGVFAPWGEITREQASVMVRNACRVVGIDVSDTSPASFADINTASEWARDSINFVRNANIMSGTGNNNFSPKALYSYKQSYVTFNNILLSHKPQPREHVEFGGIEYRLTDADVLERIMAFKDIYPHGTSIYGLGTSYFGDRDDALVCEDFVHEVARVVFSDLPRYNSPAQYWSEEVLNQVVDYSKIRVGDVILHNTSLGRHIAVIIAVNGSRITVAESNMDEKISWTRVINLADWIERDRDFDMMTYYPR